MTESQMGGTSAHFRALLAVFYASRERKALIGLALGLVVVIGATAYWQIRLNAWNQPFYDALADRNLKEFVAQLGVFAFIASVLLVLNVGQTWLNQMMKLKLRESLTHDLVEQWLAPKRAYILAGAGEIGINPDQRLHEDARRLTELLTDLGVGLLQAGLLLVSFIGVLWVLSADVTFSYDGYEFSVPGYMVWSALAYTGAASWASWLYGRRLVGLNAERYSRESNLRFALVHVNEQSEGIAVHGGEAGATSRLRNEIARLVEVLRQIVGATTGLTWITAGFGWFMIIAPVLIAAPAYFAGNLTFGGLLMAVGAFNQVQQSLRWFVDNVSIIADWRATLFRVCAFREALIEIDAIDGKVSRVERAITGEDAVRIDGLGILSPSGCTRLSEPQLTILRPERVLIAGAPGSGKTNLFRALAGLWPWGEGRISLPPAETMMFLPKRAYLPFGTLREVLGWPAPAGAFSEADLRGVLARMGLGYLEPRLDQSMRWDRELTEPEQQGLAFARMLLQRPKWVVVDEAFGSLTPEMRATLIDAFAHELRESAVINISGPLQGEDFYDRRISLELDPEAKRLSLGPLARLGEAAGEDEAKAPGGCPAPAEQGGR